jgi:hypothetical protein
MGSDLAPPLRSKGVCPRFAAFEAAFAVKLCGRIVLCILYLARCNLGDHNSRTDHVGGAALAFGASGHFS